MGAAKWEDRPSAAELLQIPPFKQASRHNGLFETTKSNKKKESSL